MTDLTEKDIAARLRRLEERVLRGPIDPPEDVTGYASDQDIQNLEDGKADTPHNNDDHSVDYSEVGHDNTDHTETYAVDGDSQPPEDHDNTAHTETYATTGENVENFSTAGAADTVPVAQADGSLAMEPPGGATVASETDDGSDITAYTLSNAYSGTPIDITGSGILLGGSALGGGDDGFEITITVDGGTSYTQTGVQTRDANGDYITLNDIPPIKFETSLQLEVNIGSNLEQGGIVAWVKQ